MNKILSKLFFIIFFFSFAITVKAGDLSINANKSVVNGNSIKVSVNISNLAGRFKVTSSDQSILAGGAEDWYEDSFTVTFSAKKVGSATITVTAVDAADMDTEQAFTGSRSLTINVTAPNTKQQIDINKKYSSDNFLKELSIEGATLSPAFTKDNLEYTVSLDYDVEKINVIGKANDAKANVKGLGEINVNEGSNSIEIVVTAENGNERVYKINAIVEDKNPIKVTVDKKEYTVMKKIDPEIIPNNYQEAKIKIDDIETSGLYNEVTDYTLVALKDSDGKIALFIYKANEGTYEKYKELTFNSNIVLLEKKPNKIIDGYKKVEITINDEKVVAYQKDKKSSYYLLYGLNIENGNEGWYRYDKIEDSIQRFDDSDINQILDDKNKYYITTIVMSSISLLLLLSIMILLFKIRKKER